jgi:HEAT repeat protein
VNVAELVLDYIQALIWPALAIFVVIRFRRGIGDFLVRIAGESEEFSASAFGVELSAKFQERLANLKEESDTADPEQLRESVKETVRDFTNDQFGELAAEISDAPYGARRELAQAIATVAENMELDDILGYVSSPSSGERLGAGIGLRVQLQAAKAAPDDPRVVGAIRALLNDRSSLVRYRAVEAVRAAPQLAVQLEPELRVLADNEKNREVRETARKALARAGL